MNYDIIFFGGGVGSINGLVRILENKKFNNSIKKNIKIAIVDKSIKNIPGGVGYGKKTSDMGFFNNPCRLSPKNFIQWSLNRKNKIDLCKYLENSKNFSFEEWLTKNKKKYLESKSIKDLSEIYFPRVFFNFWMEYRLFKSIQKKK